MVENNIIVPSPKNFNIIVIGQIVSVLGSALLRFALSLYVLDITGRADIYATLYAVSNIPLLLAPLGGAIADRFNRRNIMIILDFISSFIIICFIFIMSSGSPSIIVIGIVMVLLSIISSMYTPAVTSSIPLLVKEENLERSNGIVQAVQSLSNVLAPVLGGILYGVLGLKTLVIFSGITFLISGIMILFIKIPFEKRSYKGSIAITIFRDMKDGFSYVIKQSFILKSLIIAMLLNLLLTPYFIVGVPIILRVTMKSTNLMYGIGMGAVEIATILGALSIGFFVKKMRINNLYKWILYVAILLIPMAVALTPILLNLGFYPSFIIFILCSIPVMMLLTIISIFVITKVQKKTPNDNLGKVMSIMMAVSTCMLPLGQIIYGFVFERFKGQEFLPTLCASIFMLLVAIFSKKVLKNEKE